MGLSSHILEWGKQTTVLIKFFFFFCLYSCSSHEKVHSSLKADSTGATYTRHSYGNTSAHTLNTRSRSISQVYKLRHQNSKTQHFILSNVWTKLQTTALQGHVGLWQLARHLNSGREALRIWGKPALSLVITHSKAILIPHQLDLLSF